MCISCIHHTNVGMLRSSGGSITSSVGGLVSQTFVSAVEGAAGGTEGDAERAALFSTAVLLAQAVLLLAKAFVAIGTGPCTDCLGGLLLLLLPT